MNSDNNKERIRLAGELLTLRVEQAAIGRRINEVEEQIAVLDKDEEDAAVASSSVNECPKELWDADDTIRASETLVTRGSSLEDKYELFTKLFAGRPDVHAIVWENGEGYSPDCGWSAGQHGALQIWQGIPRLAVFL